MPQVCARFWNIMCAVVYASVVFFLVHLQLIVIYCRTKFERMAFGNASAEATVQRTTQISTHDLGKMRERARFGFLLLCWRYWILVMQMRSSGSSDFRLDNYSANHFRKKRTATTNWKRYSTIYRYIKCWSMRTSGIYF